VQAVRHGPRTWTFPLTRQNPKISRALFSKSCLSDI
jgi:hypothetical protein